MPLILLFRIGMPAHAQKPIDQKVKILIGKMTLDEKIGQLNQYSGDIDPTGPVSPNTDLARQVREGKVGSLLNVRGAARTRAFQELAMQTRLKIPLLFGLDVIHGYRNTFPIPLAEASSWDMAAIQSYARVAATEAAASGIHWTFAPMADISRDPRWGRVMEGAGEDPYLGSQIAAARVKGFQGEGLGSNNAIMACVKHFAGYGAPVAGRDYNSVDMSLHTLYEFYLPPYKAAAQAGAATFMNAFPDLNGVPCTGNDFLIRGILKKDWNFKGFVVSDWGSIGEMVIHGYVPDKKEAAKAAIQAGCDMDMESRSYLPYLAQLVKSGKVPIRLVDEAVSRILYKKFEMGLFENPYRFCDLEKEKRVISDTAGSVAARMAAERSIVLLKNEGNLLPLNKNLTKIAVVGPLAKAKKDMQGGWAVEWPDTNRMVSLYDGLANKLKGKTELLYARGCGIRDSSRLGFNEAVRTASQAEVVIMAVGEDFEMSGESKSRTNIHLPGIQEELVKTIHASGKPLIVLVMGGRPLIFNWTADHAPAILFTWWLGSEAGNAMANVLFGDYNPSAKLTMTFPVTEGQIPVYYNHNNTGRPLPGDKYEIYHTSYIDAPNTPKFAFGYGLSYTKFSYTDLLIDDTRFNQTGNVEVSFRITNNGKYFGEEIAELYIHDKFASIVRPLKELKGFQKLSLNPGESKIVKLKLTKDSFSFYNQSLRRVIEPGEFEIMVGPSSDHIILQKSIFYKPGIAAQTKH